MALRAAVRAHVTATFAQSAGADARHQIQIARQYFDLARQLLADPEPLVVGIGGLSGSGKSTVAEALAPRLGVPPGARIVESDRTRKAMFEIRADAPLPQDAYRPEVSDDVYERLGQRASALAGSGACVVVDAVFDREDRRRGQERTMSGHAFSGFWLSCSPDTLRKRITDRPKGPSDATIAVLEHQLVRDIGHVTWTAIPGDEPLENVVAAILAHLGQAG
jgi:predicted kinase